MYRKQQISNIDVFKLGKKKYVPHIKRNEYTCGCDTLQIPKFLKISEKIKNLLTSFQITYKMNFFLKATFDNKESVSSSFSC